jgi:hypothetical protein
VADISKKVAMEFYKADERQAKAQGRDKGGKK